MHKNYHILSNTLQHADLTTVYKTKIRPIKYLNVSPLPQTTRRISLQHDKLSTQSIWSAVSQQSCHPVASTDTFCTTPPNTSSQPLIYIPSNSRCQLKGHRHSFRGITNVFLILGQNNQLVWPVTSEILYNLEFFKQPSSHVFSTLIFC
jgi:hypothetical protein